jgi:iron complex outermembrane receptor protein
MSERWINIGEATQDRFQTWRGTMKKNVFLGVASAMALTAGSQAYAQTTQVTSDGDIIVTATRTETLLSKTPIAMTAVSGDQLVQKGITNTTQLADSVPNVSIVRGNGLQITIRGVTSTDGTEKGDPSAAFLADGIYLARPQARKSASLTSNAWKCCAVRKARCMAATPRLAWSM